MGGCGSSRDELRGAQRTAQPTGPNTPSIAASKKTISERPGADVHSLACLLYSRGILKGVGRLQPCMLVGGGGSSPQLKRFDRCAMAASRSTSSQSLACPSAPCFAVLLPVLRPARLRLLHCASRCSRLRGCCSLCCSLCCRDCDDDGAGGRLSRPEHAAAASKCSCSAPLTCSAPTICSAPPTLKGAADKVPIVYSWRAVFTQAQKNGQMARWQPGHSRPRTPTPRRPGWAGRPCRGP